jgi:pyruvyltransferase
MLNHTIRRLLKRPEPITQTHTRASGSLPYPHVSLLHYRPPDGSVNFGDHLARIVVDRVLGLRQRTRDDEVARPSRLLAIGSILHLAHDGDVIWGSGINGKVPASSFTARQLDVRAVRGPLSEQFLRARGFDVPRVYGDPGLLVSHLFGERFKPTGRLPYVFVPNLHDLTLVAHEPHVVSPLWGWNTVVSRILEAQLVLASSLHGLIVAEAFGVPARYVRLSETENLFKYEDYYFGTGRAQFAYARSIAEGRAMGGMPAFTFDPQPLLTAFPWDLWEDSGDGAAW